MIKDPKKTPASNRAMPHFTWQRQRRANWKSRASLTLPWSCTASWMSPGTPSPPGRLSSLQGSASHLQLGTPIIVVSSSDLSPDSTDVHWALSRRHLPGLSNLTYPILSNYSPSPKTLPPEAFPTHEDGSSIFPAALVKNIKSSWTSLLLLLCFSQVDFKKKKAVYKPISHRSL